MDLPKIEDNRQPPKGVISDKTKSLIIMGFAFGLVLFIFLNDWRRGSEGKAEAGKTSTTPEAPRPESVDVFRKGLENQLNEQRQAQMKRAAEANSQPDARQVQTEIIQQAPVGDSRAQRLQEEIDIAAKLSPLALRREIPVPQPKETETNPTTDLGEVASRPPATQERTIDKKPEPPQFNKWIGDTYLVPEGTVLECVLVNRLEGSFAGPVIARVTTPVYSHNGKHVLIPVGTVAIGEAKQVTDQDQNRLAVGFHLLRMPDEFKVSLDHDTGLDQGGATGLKDKVNRHMAATIGTSVALGLLGGLEMSGTGSAFTASGWDMYRQGIAQQIGMQGSQVLYKMLNRMPEITIEEGHRLKIFLGEDRNLPDYSMHRMPEDL